MLVVPRVAVAAILYLINYPWALHYCSYICGNRDKELSLFYIQSKVHSQNSDFQPLDPELFFTLYFRWRQWLRRLRRLVHPLT